MNVENTVNSRYVVSSRMRILADRALKTFYLARSRAKSFGKWIATDDVYSSVLSIERKTLEKISKVKQDTGNFSPRTRNARPVREAIFDHLYSFTVVNKFKCKLAYPEILELLNYGYCRDH